MMNGWSSKDDNQGSTDRKWTASYVIGQTKNSSNDAKDKVKKLEILICVQIRARQDIDVFAVLDLWSLRCRRSIRRGRPIVRVLMKVTLMLVTIC